MDIPNVRTIVGLDDITDFSENFKDGKEEFFEILTYINDDKDIITLFTTLEDEIAFFSSGITESGEKEFLLFISDTPLNLLKFFRDKYTEVYLDFELNIDIKEKQAKSILVLSKSLVALSNLTEEELDEDIS